MENKVKAQKMCESIIAITDEVCQKHLNQDYAELSRDLATALGRKRPSPLCNGNPKSWACAIVYALGKVNFIFDKTQNPHFSSRELCALFQVSLQTASSKANAIWNMMKMFPLDPRWCISKNLAHNPILQTMKMMDIMEMMEEHNTQKLIEKMTANLPIPVYPNGEIIKFMYDKGYKISQDQKLLIKAVFYMSDEGGIVCDITPDGENKSAIVVSLTRLQIDPAHPMANEIRDYQKWQIEMLVKR